MYNHVEKAMYESNIIGVFFYKNTENLSFMERAMPEFGRICFTIEQISRNS